MVRIIPRVFPPDTVSVAERHFFTALVEQLDDSFWVIHSVPWLSIASRQIKQGECDLLILYPRFRMLSIEMKPGDLFCDGASSCGDAAMGRISGKTLTCRLKNLSTLCILFFAGECPTGPMHTGPTATPFIFAKLIAYMGGCARKSTLVQAGFVWSSL